MDRRENEEEENIRGLVLHVTCPMYQNYIFTLRTLCPQEKHGRKIPVYDWVRKRSIFKESGGIGMILCVGGWRKLSNQCPIDTMNVLVIMKKSLEKSLPVFEKLYMILANDKAQTLCRKAHL